jgi:hypothetical protein
VPSLAELADLMDRHDWHPPWREVEVVMAHG